MPAGRPPTYSKEDFIRVIDRIANGELAIHVCKEHGNPSTSALWEACCRDSELQEMYARAREAQAWRWTEECLDIADENEYDTAYDEDGKLIVNYEHINRARLKVDTRKWAVTKIAARVFGEKKQIEHSGEISTPMLTIVRNDSDE